MLAQYRLLLHQPHVGSTVLLALMARIPLIAAPFCLILHVATTGGSYFAATCVSIVNMLGTAIGAVLLGGLVDRRGLRAVVAITTVTESAFWMTAPHVSTRTLGVVAFMGGLVALPAVSLGRQALTGAAPVSMRRPALALDAMVAELAFILGPSIVAALSATSNTVAMDVMAATVAIVGICFFAVNPPIVGCDEDTTGPRGDSARADLGNAGKGATSLAGALVIGGGCTATLAGMEVALLAAFRAQGATAWLGMGTTVICVSSLAGVTLYGRAKYPPRQSTLACLLSALTSLIGLFGSSLIVLIVALIPANMCCAPSLTATTEAVVAAADADKRGRALGLHNAAVTLGTAVGSTLAGLTIDAIDPAAGFIIAGLIGITAALVVRVLTLASIFHVIRCLWVL